MKQCDNPSLSRVATLLIGLAVHPSVLSLVSLARSSFLHLAFAPPPLPGSKRERERETDGGINPDYDERATVSYRGRYSMPNYQVPASRPVLNVRD